MEENSPMIAKKIWNTMRVLFFMLKKGICKRKILMDLNLVMKRGKIARKALQKLMSHHHRDSHHGSISEVGLDCQSKPQGEYEFSCSNTPLYNHYFTNTNKRKIHHNKVYSIGDMKNIEAVNNMFDMMMMSSDGDVVASPSPLIWLESSGSPLPMENGEDDKHVDAAADEFIRNFYSQLIKQQKHY